MAKKEKKPHLGKGLEALLGPITMDYEQEVPVKQPIKAVGGPIQPLGVSSKVVDLPVDKVVRDAVERLSVDDIVANPYQPRTDWNEEALEELTESIRVNGVIQPILVRKSIAGYEIIAGERRYRASVKAGLAEIPALVRTASDEQMLELALVENIHRSDLNAIERAKAYRQYISTFNITQIEAAQRLGESRSVVANYLRLLDLPREIKSMLVGGQLSMGHARAILALPTDEMRRKLANRAMAGRLSVREVERLVRKMIQGDGEKGQPKVKPPHILDLESRLRESLGTKVQIEARKKGDRGRIIIDFYSLDEFDKITEIIGMGGADTL
ncbi:MAG: ParB/RepB/Spo0J family partition protein [Planctomycetes bacterium]|nr:ParB/RepB/Spo0J family partition protein [Planctomycetota bacterium]